MVDVANLATYCHYDGDVILEVLGPLRKCYVSSLLGLTTFPLTRARARVSGKRLVAFGSQSSGSGSWAGTPGCDTECTTRTHGELGRDTGDTTGHTWSDAMLVVLLPKLWFWIENHDWHNCFWMSL